MNLMNYSLWLTNHGPKITDHGPPVTNHEQVLNDVNIYNPDHIKYDTLYFVPFLS